jgi:conjugative relaxase-like TrwC/TraI family protein
MRGSLIATWRLGNELVRGASADRSGIAAVMSVSAIGAGGADYYAKDDYYFGRVETGASGEAADTVDRSTPLTWGGRGAARLGLGGAARLQDFRAVMGGCNPDPSGAPLSVKDRRAREGQEATAGEGGVRAGHRAGFDLTFSAPKSVSVAALVGGDERLIDAHSAAIGVVMDYVEDHYALTRRRDGRGGIEQVNIGNLVYARTTHATSRAGDPNLHTHVIVSNAVFDEGKGEWRALNNREIFANQVMLGLIYQRELAASLMREGYDVRSANAKGISAGKAGMFEIADCPQTVLEAFSKRHEQIRANAELLNPQTPAQFEIAVLKDRPTKIDTPANELRGVWEKEAADHGFDSRAWAAAKSQGFPGRDVTATRIGIIRPISLAVHRLGETARGLFEPAFGLRGPTGAPATKSGRAQAALAEAVESSETKSAVFSKGDVFRIAMKSARADVSFAALEREWAARVAGNQLRRADISIYEGVTTPLSLETEANIVAAVKNGIGRSAPLYDPFAALQRARSGLATADGARVQLGSDQIRAATLVLSSPDKFVAVQGVAGAGKSTMFALIGAAAREKGVTIVGMAPTHGAKEALADKAGFDVMTVQRFLAAHAGLADGRARATPEQLAHWRGKIVVLDEASMIDNMDKLKLTRLADVLALRKFVLVGDRGQLPAITAGAPFSLLLDTIIPHAVMDTLRRQRAPDLRAAVGRLAQGQSGGLRNLQGRVVEVGERAGAHDLAAEAFKEWRAAHDQGVCRPIITVSQEERSVVNGMIIRHLEAAGEAAQLGPKRDTLVQRHLAGPERWKAISYRPDQVLVFHSRLAASGIGKGEHVRIVGLETSNSGNLLTVLRQDGQIATIGLNALRRRGVDKFASYEAVRGQFYTGAAYVFERSNTDRAINVKAGEGFEVVGETGDRINLRLSSGRMLSLASDDKQLLFVGPGYAMTTHRSQGLTMTDDPIGILSSRNATLAGAYVQLSRAVSGITIVTDSFDNLVRNISKRDGRNPIATFSLRPEQSPDKNLARPGKGHSSDPSLNKPDPEKSITQDRPLPSDRSM